MKLGASILALLLSSSAQAANIDIQWSIQEYADTTAQVGDTIPLTWDTLHNIYIHPSGTCDETGAIIIGETSPVTYTFTADDANEDLIFICGIPGHCDAGQTITVSVTEAGDAATTESLEPSSVPMVSESLEPSAVVAEGVDSSAVPSSVLEIESSQAPSSVGGEVVGTPAPTVFDLGNETDTDMPTISPMDDASIPSMGPSAVGGSAGGTQAPSASSIAADGSSGATRGTVAGLASATLAMALTWFIE